MHFYRFKLVFADGAVAFDYIVAPDLAYAIKEMRSEWPGATVTHF